MLTDREMSELSYFKFCKYKIFECKILQEWVIEIFKDLKKLLKNLIDFFIVIINILTIVFFPIGLFIYWISLRRYIKRRDKQNENVIKG